MSSSRSVVFRIEVLTDAVAPQGNILQDLVQAIICIDDANRNGSKVRLDVTSFDTLAPMPDSGPKGATFSIMATMPTSHRDEDAITEISLVLDRVGIRGYKIIQTP